MNKFYPISFAVFALILFSIPVKAQFQPPSHKIFTRQDTLRGSITPERKWWDLTYYHLDIIVKPSDSTIYGANTVTYRVMNSADVMQIDLQEPLSLSGAEQNGNPLKFVREGSIYWIHLAEKQEPGKIYSVILSYGGKPKNSHESTYRLYLRR